MWHPLCKRKKNWNCFQLSVTTCIDLILLTMLTFITYSADVLVFWAPFWKGGGALFGLMRRYVYIVWWNFILQYQLFFVTSAGFVFNMYTYQVWILSLECAEWFFVTINVWLKKPVNVCPWAINQNTCTLLPLRFSKFQIPWNGKMVKALICSNSIIHIMYMDPIYNLLQMVNVLSKTFKLIKDLTSKSFIV